MTTNNNPTRISIVLDFSKTEAGMTRKSEDGIASPVLGRRIFNLAS